jgi:hypothetical protein
VGTRFALDSPLEGTGFEPSVPQEAPGILVVSVLVRADFFSRPGNQAEVTWARIQNLVVSRGTDGSNPAPSSGESAELSVPKRRSPICGSDNSLPQPFRVLRRSCCFRETASTNFSDGHLRVRLDPPIGRAQGISAKLLAVPNAGPRRRFPR